MADPWTCRDRKAPARVESVAYPSVVTDIELAPCRQYKNERARLKRGLGSRQTEVLRIAPAISERAADLVDAFALSQTTRLADALIGATALEHGLTLPSANTGHFSAINGWLLAVCGRVSGSLVATGAETSAFCAWAS